MILRYSHLSPDHRLAAVQRSSRPPVYETDHPSLGVDDGRSRIARLAPKVGEERVRELGQRRASRTRTRRAPDGMQWRTVNTRSWLSASTPAQAPPSSQTLAVLSLWRTSAARPHAALTRSPLGMGEPRAGTVTEARNAITHAVRHALRKAAVTAS